MDRGILARIATNVCHILQELGENAGNENFQKTPERVAKFLLEFSRFKKQTAQEILKVTFPCTYDQMVMQKNINFVSLCAHHMLPFKGTAAVAYIPSKRVVGLSKLARLVHHCARRLTLQEQVTVDIADALEKALNPLGVMVVLEAEHSCMSIRGVQEPNAVTITSDVRGVFHTNERGTKEEFLRLLRMP